MAQPAQAPVDDDKYFDMLCHVAKRGRVEQLKTLLAQYNVRKHYSKRDESGVYFLRRASCSKASLISCPQKAKRLSTMQPQQAMLIVSSCSSQRIQI